MADTRLSNQADFAFQIGSSTPDDFQVIRFRAQEGLSDLYTVELDLASSESAAVIEGLVGQPAVLTIMSDQGTRWFHGIVCQLEQGGEGVRFTNYHVRVVPTLWLLTLRHQSRIFQKMTVPEILTQVLKDAGIAANQFRQNLTKKYPKRDYCVQYRETDFTFISRLMEEEGIFYFFEQTVDSHVMVMGDNPSVHKPVPDKPECVFREASGMVPKEEFIYQFRYGQNIRTGLVTLRDFNFKQPSLGLQVQQVKDAKAALEFSDYPGGYDDPGAGKDLAKVRLEELQAFQKFGTGSSTCRRLACGYRFTLKDHYRQDFNKDYLVVRGRHTGAHPQLLGEEGGAASASDEPLYQNQFEFIPADVPFRPSRRAPRPIVEGTQTALVVGPKGEEIYTDEFGRVKVQFHWDRQGKYDENSSCWIRVAGGWGGGQYGSIFLPRVGQEVVVDFLEGNPDQPLIVGRVYNGDLMPPYKLPDEKTKSVIKTQSSKGGGGTNEIRFEDKKDNEQFLIHAQKDFHVRVTNDRVENIEHDRHLTVDNDKTEEIGRDKSVHVKGKESYKVDGTLSVTCGGDAVEKFQANHKHEVATTYAAKAMSIKLEGSTGIELKCGGSSIVLTPAAIFIVGGPLVNINSGSGPSVSPVSAGATSPGAPLKADDVKPGKDVTYSGGEKPPPGTAPVDVKGLAPTPPPPPKKTKTSWIEIELVDEAGQPVPGEPYEITAPDGKTIIRGTLDANGQAHVGIPESGNCQISFPNLDAEAWERKS